jgi:hypothetical protein
MTCLRKLNSVFVLLANAGPRPLRLDQSRGQLDRMAFGMPETNLSSHGSAEIMGNLTFWHVACQKYLNCGS